MTKLIDLKRSSRAYNFNIEIDLTPFQRVKEMQKQWQKSKLEV